MKLSDMYSEKIKHLPQHIQESIIKEAPHTRIQGAMNFLDTQFLHGAFIDLGFENLGLDPAQQKVLQQNFIAAGLRIPGTSLKLRYDRTGITKIEQAEGGETTLPEDWKEAVLVLDADDNVSYAGKYVRPEQTG